MNTKQPLSLSAAEMQDLVDSLDGASELLVQVEGHNGECISATIYPIALDPAYVVGSVDWYGPTVFSSIVRADIPESPEFRELLLVWAAVGENSVDAVPILGIGRWRSAQLTLQDPEGQPGRVTVQVDSSTWQAVMTITGADAERTEVRLLVPKSSGGRDVASVLVGMAARFLYSRLPRFLCTPVCSLPVARPQ
ncbi:hypothetical protein [Polaromonas sp. SM01]|uniref:hypothetical protein n=1 Tax=Polaromonas sp. SM01 TaxID=3085630 RepID=UPI002980C710|nr:hypothetical protein [Polaromonas sp. SM01]MDW5443800.1 hypothetical protein [Polaromonas sp. SM01]